MWELWRRILADLGRPDDQGRDWYAWGTVQVAHAGIGVALAGLLLAFGAAPWSGALFAALAYGLGKEMRDYRQARGWRTARDCLRDSLFVAGGCTIAAALHTHSAAGLAVALAAVVLGLAVGVYQRAAGA